MRRHLQNRSLVVGVTLVLGGIVGGLTGGLLAAYWWDFPPQDLLDYSQPGSPRSIEGWVVGIYSDLGVVVALVVVGFFIAVVSAYFEIRGRARKI